MTEAEIKALQEKLEKASLLQKGIDKARERIKKINAEISTQQDGSCELNIRLKTFPIIPFEKVYGTDEATDEEIIALGEFMINALQKKIDEWKAELEEL